jgi:hypothetical protein
MGSGQAPGGAARQMCHRPTPRSLIGDRSVAYRRPDRSLIGDRQRRSRHAHTLTREPLQSFTGGLHPRRFVPCGRREGRPLLSLGHKLSDAARRALPVLAVLAALVGASLQPSLQALRGLPGSPQQTNGPAADTSHGSDRFIVQSKPGKKVQVSAQRRLSSPPSAPPPAPLATPDDVAPPDVQSSSPRNHLRSQHVAAPKRLIAQPRAPPFSRTVIS